MQKVSPGAPKKIFFLFFVFAFFSVLGQNKLFSKNFFLPEGDVCTYHPPGLSLSVSELLKGVIIINITHVSYIECI